jgi:hypothetical protein
MHLNLVIIIMIIYNEYLYRIDTSTVKTAVINVCTLQVEFPIKMTCPISRYYR